MAREKMHQAFQRINNDTMGMQHRGSNSLPRKFHKQKDFKSSSEVHRVSSLTWSNSDNRCSVLTFLTVEPNGHWRVVAVPLHYPDSKILGSSAQVGMNSLHLVSPWPIKSVQPDRQKVTKGPALGGRYSPNSRTCKSITGSTVQPQPENKAVLANKTKWKELPKIFSHKSFPSSESSSPISNSSIDIKPSAESVDDSNVDDVAKRRSRKKNRKKGKNRKKNQCQTGGSEPGMSVEDHSQVGSVAETCNKNNVDHNDALLPSSETLETLLLDNGDRESEDMLEEAIPVSKKSSENHSVGSFEKKRQPKHSAVAVCDGFKDMNHTQVSSSYNSCSRDRNNRPHFSVLDPVPTHPHSNHRYRTNYSHRPASSFRKGFFGCKNFSYDTVDSCNNANEISPGSQRSNSRDLYSAIADRRNTPNKMFPQFLSVSRFGGVGNFQGRVGKENTHSVWQKVQRNESSGDSKSAPTSLQLDVPMEETSLLKINRDGYEDAMQFKGADSGKWRTKSRAVSNQECKLYPQNESLVDIANSDGSLKVAASLDVKSRISSDVSDRNVTTIVAESHPQNESDHSTHSDMKSQRTGVLNHSLAKSCNSSDQSKVMKVQSPEFIPNHVSSSGEQGHENIPLADVGVQTSGSDMQKWVSIGPKDHGATNSAACSSVEPSDNASSESKVDGDSENIVPKAEAVSISQTSEGTIHLSHSGECRSRQLRGQQASLLREQKYKKAVAQCSNTVAGYLIVAEAADRIAEAVNRAYSLQLESESVEKVYGWPLSEFERVLHYSSPVIYQPTNLVCHVCSKDQFGSASLCRHEKPNVSLESLWNWYEDLGSYGLKVSGDDFENKKRIGEGCFQYTVYFTPYLSAIQLFKKCDNHSGDANNSISSSEVLDSSQFTETPDRPSRADHLPVSRELFQTRKELESSQTEANQVVSLEPSSVSAKGAASVRSAESPLLNGAELLFEYFESLQPPQRPSLYDKIKNLVSGDGEPQYRGHGDPTYLKSVKLDDLHHSSWYSVAWYPIYRIPEDTFRAAFLTYHSLGHLKRGSARFGSMGVQDSIVFPAVGLQSYNAHNECWFNPQSSMPNHLKPASLNANQSRILKERLRTLEETALRMARAVLTKGNLTSANQHHDYEFFCSRRRY